MKSEIELLDANLLSNKEVLEKIDFWQKVLNRPNGWHYDLDIIWTVENLKNHGVMPGSTILDAGAGFGLTQFLLASLGYNIISLDFAPRDFGYKYKQLFDMDGDGVSQIAYFHDYMNIINYGDKNLLQNLSKLNNLTLVRLLEKLYLAARSVIYFTYAKLLQDRRKFGSIRVIRAPFHDIPLDAKSVDGVISISAIEHADIELFSTNLNTLKRLVKKKGVLLITTSAADTEKNYYNKNVAGWCFSKNYLCKKLPGAKILFNYHEKHELLINSSVFINRIDKSYFRPGMLFERTDLSSLPYIPVGIKCVNV